jgi:hypothetical protein
MISGGRVEQLGRLTLSAPEGRTDLAGAGLKGADVFIHSELLTDLHAIGMVSRALTFDRGGGAYPRLVEISLDDGRLGILE